jgi:hypothetical protein
VHAEQQTYSRFAAAAFKKSNRIRQLWKRSQHVDVDGHDGLLDTRRKSLNNFSIAECEATSQWPQNAELSTNPQQ